MISREVDPNEAPEGYYATQELSHAMCVGCVFDTGPVWIDGEPMWRLCHDAGCSPSKRKDKCFVIFKEKEA